jgi:hypothetical protein
MNIEENIKQIFKKNQVDNDFDKLVDEFSAMLEVFFMKAKQEGDTKEDQEKALEQLMLRTTVVLKVSATMCGATTRAIESCLDDSNEKTIERLGEIIKGFCDNFMKAFNESGKDEN